VKTYPVAMPYLNYVMFLRKICREKDGKGHYYWTLVKSYRSPDCKQACIGLVVTKEGIPLGYEVFEGNKHDPKTVETIVNKMEALNGESDRAWIMDRCMVSQANLKLVGSEGRRRNYGKLIPN